MKLSKNFGKTQKETPGDAELISHQLLIQSGLIHQVASGIYSYMPIAWRSLKKIENIVRDEIDKAGGQEIRMPVLQPQEIWDISGRTEIFGPDLFKLSDRRKRKLVMAPTHEEVLTLMVKNHVNTYKDLPLLIYQIQTKFRDEIRPRGGLIRVREFDMKDAYSFDISDEGLDQNYNAMITAYENIYNKIGLETIKVEADSGAIGGKASHEFMAVSKIGEDTILKCSKCSYAANSEKAEFIRIKQKTISKNNLPLEEISTPEIKTIEALAKNLSLDPDKMLKTLIYIDSDNQPLAAIIRGDLDVNETKLSNLNDGKDLRLATPKELSNLNIPYGFASPIQLKNIKIVVDTSINFGNNYIIGSNQENVHYKNSNYPRDFSADIVNDIALAKPEHLCVKCSNKLELKKGIEVGHVFKLGTKYSEKLGAMYINRENKQIPIIMGCYGIGIGRLLSAVIEQNNDQKGIIFPKSIAPFDAMLCVINIRQENIRKIGEEFYSNLMNSGLDILYDDRDESPGVKFKDSDLLGLPLRIVLSERNLKNQQVEIQERKSGKQELVSFETAIEKIKKKIQL